MTMASSGKASTGKTTELLGEDLRGCRRRRIAAPEGSLRPSARRASVRGGQGSPGTGISSTVELSKGMPSRCTGQPRRIRAAVIATTATSAAVHTNGHQRRREPAGIEPVPGTPVAPDRARRHVRPRASRRVTRQPFGLTRRRKILHRGLLSVVPTHRPAAGPDSGPRTTAGARPGAHASTSMARRTGRRTGERVSSSSRPRSPCQGLSPAQMRRVRRRRC